MAVPYSFGSATSAIPLSQLDSNFATVITLGNTAIQLGNTVTTLNNMTLANVTISSGSVTLTSASVTNANVTSTLTLDGGTANGVAYLNGSKVLTTGTDLVFTSTGLGIGTSSPAYKLDVQATGYPFVNIASTSGSGANGSLFQAKNGGGAASFFGTETTSGSYSYTGSIANAAYAGSGGANPFQLITNSIARATIDSAGNLGLGVTPSAWNATYKALQLQGGSVASESVTLKLFQNAYVNTSGVEVYSAALPATKYVQYNGTHSWYRNTSTPSAGADPVFTQAMTLDASGNLLVGVTSGLGSTRATFSNSAAAQAAISLQSTSTSGYSSANFYDNSGTQTGAVGYGNSSAAVTGAAGNVYMYSTGAITFLSGGTTERARIDSSGNLGLGVTPSAISANFTTLSIQGSSGGGLRMGTAQNFYVYSDASNAYLNQTANGFMAFSTNNTERMRIASNGIVTMSAYGAGAATFSASGVISSVSDETWKIKDGAPVDPDAMLKKLEPGYWYYNDEKKEIFGAERQLGFYAQNVNTAIGPEAAPEPEVVITKAEDGSDVSTTKPWGYYDRSVLAVVVMSLQKALATIETLETRLTALESK